MQDKTGGREGYLKGQYARMSRSSSVQQGTTDGKMKRREGKSKAEQSRGCKMVREKKMRGE